MDAMRGRKRRGQVPDHLRPVPEGRAEDREVQRRGAKMDEAIKLEKEKLAKKKLEKEAKLEQKKLVHEMKVFKAKQLEKAKRLFVGNVLQQNFVAWKEYTQKTIRKREERRRRRKKAIKWCLFCSIFCTLFILGSIYLVNLYVQEQERRQGSCCVQAQPIILSQGCALGC